MRRTEHFVISASQTAERCDVAGFVRWGVSFTEVDAQEKHGDSVEALVVIKDQGDEKLNEVAAISRVMDLLLAIRETKLLRGS